MPGFWNWFRASLHRFFLSENRLSSSERLIVILLNAVISAAIGDLVNVISIATSFI